MKLESYLKKLIAFKTVTGDHKENQKAFDWIKENLKNFPLFYEDFSSNGFPSLLITTKKTKTPRIWLQAHMDVVPGPEEVFKPRIVGTKLYGRGTFDMKFAIAAYMQLFNDLGKDLPSYDLGIMITSDEEIGGANGVGKLVPKGYTSKICILPDGGENWIFQGGAKGIYQVKVESTGKAAHGARPWKGKNAIEELMKFLELVQQSFPAEPCGDQDHYHNTLTIGKISGGTAMNQVPVQASAYLDIRYTPEYSEKKIKELLEKAKRQCKNIELMKEASGQSYKVDTKNAYFKLFSDLVHKHTHKETSLLFSPGSSDGRYFINAGVPAILIRPTGANLHRDDEWIDVHELETFYNVLKEFVQQTK